MKAYIGWTFGFYYRGILARWALSQELPRLREHTQTVCYERLMDERQDTATLERMYDFLFNGTDHKHWERGEGTAPSGGDGYYTGKHSTSHDPNQRNHLIEIIQKLDEEVFNGEIAWLNRTLPC